jgi:hypothetical protein
VKASAVLTIARQGLAEGCGDTTQTTGVPCNHMGHIGGMQPQRSC